jgi:TPR repeat protein
LEGRGVKVDEEQAVSWLIKSKNAGHEKAVEKLKSLSQIKGSAWQNIWK